MSTKTSSKKMEQVVRAMQRYQLDALIIPTADAHQTEFVAPKDQRRAWISGFSGSSGTALIIRENDSGKGYLWTDGRYFTQAANELEPQTWTLMKQGVTNEVRMSDFILNHFSKQTLSSERSLFNVGVDPKYLGIQEYIALKDKLEPEKENTKKINFKSTPNVIDECMTVDIDVSVVEPQELNVYPECYSGESTLNKVRKIQENLFKKDNKLSSTNVNKFFVVTDLSELAWLLNIRGRNILPCSPFFYGYAIITPQTMHVFSDFKPFYESCQGLKQYVDSLAATSTPELSIKVHEYESFQSFLSNLVVPTEQSVTELLVYLTKTTNYSIYETIANSSKLEKVKLDKCIEYIDSPIQLLKAVKNDVEILRMKETHINDACALVQYFSWLEKTVQGGTRINEIEAAKKLLAFRKEISDFDTLSFPTISSYGSNGAIIHYDPNKSPELVKVIGVDNIYLCDSGGQYKTGGTTDITRTMHFGQPTDEMKKYFTLVLDGHGALASAVFPENSEGFKLDILARSPLWSIEEDYGHGTGHGVGAYLNVHEFPPSVSGYASRQTEANKLKPGMILSNEPGYYLEGKFGIRIENLVVVKYTDKSSSKIASGTQDKKFCEFETISLVPIQRRLVDLKYLSEKSRLWLNEYHKKCLLLVGERLKQLGKHDAYAWLVENTKPV